MSTSATAVNQTRKLTISGKVFTIKDLRRVAEVFDKQASLAKRSDHHASTEYAITFSDDTTYQSDSIDLFSEASVAFPARPVKIAMSFRNFKLGRHISLTLDHGNASYGNLATISGSEPEWVLQNFQILKEALDAVRPQAAWLRNHQTLLLNLIALGIGNALVWAIGLVMDPLMKGIPVQKLPPESPWRQALLQSLPLLYCILWLMYWLTGICWAFGVRDWLLRVWPSVEFDFGLEHLKAERAKRTRLVAVATLVAIPIGRTILYDIMKSKF